MKAKKSIVRLISIVMLVVMLFWMLASYDKVSSFFDTGTILFITIIPLSMIIFSNQWSDFIRAISIAMGSTEFTTREYKASLNAITLSMNCVLMSGIFGTLAGVIMQLSYMNMYPESAAAGFAIAGLSILYAMMINIVQYAIKSMINKEIIYRDHDQL
jgi:ABC-type protease/lipase transport system fused ATPase/permease subunit